MFNWFNKFQYSIVIENEQYEYETYVWNATTVLGENMIWYYVHLSLCAPVRQSYLVDMTLYLVDISLYLVDMALYLVDMALYLVDMAL
jgi:hypothetical protein